MTVVVSVQHSRGGSGATTVALTLAYNLSMHGRTLYIEADFLNPMIEKHMLSRSIIPRWSNEWITGETSLNESCIDVSGMFNLASKSLYFLPANSSEGARRRMEILDAEGDKRILKTLEREKWNADVGPLDYVVIDTPPWMYYTLTCISYISNYILYVIRPNIYELSILSDRIENVYSNFICLVIPIINMFNPDIKNMEKFEKEFLERIGIKPVKIPYLSELAVEIDLSRILDRKNRILNYLVDAVEEVVKKPRIFESI